MLTSDNYKCLKIKFVFTVVRKKQPFIIVQTFESTCLQTTILMWTGWWRLSFDKGCGQIIQNADYIIKTFAKFKKVINLKLEFTCFNDTLPIDEVVNSRSVCLQEAVIFKEKRCSFIRKRVQLKVPIAGD